MKMKNKCAAVRLEKSRLLAAMAILAVAFVVLAAVPAALADSDARSASTEIVGDVTTKEAGSTIADATGSFYVNGKVTVTAASTTVADTIIYMGPSAELIISAGVDAATEGFVVYQMDGTSTTKYFKDSAATIKGAGGSGSGAAQTLTFENGGYKLTTATDGAVIAVDGYYVEATYKSSNVVWTAGMAASAFSGKVFTLTAGSDTEPSVVKVYVKDSNNTNEYSFTVKDASKNEALFTAPFKGTAATITAQLGSTLKITANAAVSEGTIERVNGSIVIAANDTNLDAVFANGMAGVAGTSMEGAVSINNDSGGTLEIFKNTKVADTGAKITKADGTTILASIPGGLTTTSYMKVLASETETTITSDTARWTNGTITSNASTTVNLGVANGNISVAGAAEVKPVAGTILYGNLKIGTGAKMTVNQNVIVAESGSIELVDALSSTDKNAISIADSYKLDVLGTVSGKGTIRLSADPGTGKLCTADGTKKNITCVTSLVPEQATTAITHADGEDIANLNAGVALGYQKFEIQDNFVIPYDSKGYEFPAGITIAFKDANATESIIIAGQTGSDKEMQVTIPAGTEIALLGDSDTTSKIVLGASLDSSTIKTTGASSKITLNVEGKITGTGVITATARNAGNDADVTDAKATLNLGSNGSIGSAVSIEVPNVTGEKKELHLNGDTTQSIRYPVYQKIYVDEGATWTITDGNVVEIDGELEINGEIVIKNGGQLILGNGRTAASKVSVAGSIEMEEGSILTIVNADMTVSGEFGMNGLVDPTKGSINVKGTMTVGSTGVIKGVADFTYKVASAGSLTVYGYMDEPTIENSGSVVIDNGGLEARDGKTSSDATVKMVASGAQLDVMSYLIGDDGESLTVTDEGLSIGKVITSDTTARKVGKAGAPVANVVEIAAGDLAKITGELVFTEYLTSATANGTKTYTNVLQITGSVSNTTAAVGTTVQTVFMTIGQGSTGGDAPAASSTTAYAYETYVSVPADDQLTVAKDIEIDVSGDLKVLGYVDMTAQNTSGKQYMVNTGSITVEGKIKINTLTISGSADLNAAQYQTKEGSPAVTYNVYSSLSAASEDILAESNTNTEKTITIYGDIVVKDSMTIESPIAVKFATSSSDSSTLTISEDGTNTASMTVEEGAKITSGRNQVIVNGTLIIEDKATGDKTTKTVCDVTITSDESEIVYTNIYTALGTATSGATVNVTREKIASTDVVELYSSITVGEGVTLVVGDSVAPLYLKNGVTLYVNGTLQTAQDITAEKTFGTQAMNVSSGTKTSAIVVNGTLMTASAVKYGDSSSASMVAGAPIAGAYYTQGDWNVISTIAIASENQAKIASEKITVHGAIVAGDLTFAKGSNDTCKQIDVPSEYVGVTGSTSGKIYTSLTFTSLTIDEYKLTVTGPVTGAVQNDSASVELTSVAGSGLTISDASGKLTLTGAMDLGTSGSSAKVTEGTVNAGASTSFSTTGSKGTLTVASGATLEGVSVTDIVKLSVAGTLNVAPGKSVQVTDITVTGTVKVAAGTDTSAAGTFTVTGIASIGTSTSGIRSATSSSTAASASVAGPVTYGTVVVIASGASLDEDAMSGLSSMISTEFYVEDALWITVYAPSGNSEKISYYSNSSIENALFDGWVNSSGTAVKDKTIGASGYKQVYASIEYDVFHIILKADEGVDNVSITSGSTVTKLGKGMVYDSTSGIYYNAFTATVKAGTYTVSYTLKNGYGGTATLSGDGVSGMTFKAAGTPSDEDGIEIDLQLSGIEKSGYVDPVEPQKEDNSLKVTDYLLIVLVILVVVLAVIVAMRLMRS